MSHALNHCSQDPQWVLHSRLCFVLLSTHVKASLTTHKIAELLSILLDMSHTFSYLSMSLSCSRRVIFTPVSLKGGSLCPKAVGKLPGVVLRHRSRQRSWLLGICGVGRSVECLLTHWSERITGCWLALHTVTVVIFSLFGGETGFLLSQWVAGLFHLRPEDENE